MRDDVDWNEVPARPDEPDFENVLAVLRGDCPSRPTLFEFFLNGPLYERLAWERSGAGPNEKTAGPGALVPGFRNAGYDYVTFLPPGFGFYAGDVESKHTRSLNEGAVITDRASFDAYAWPDPDAANYAALDALAAHLPDGMKLVSQGPCGILENVVRLVGYDRLCYMLVDDRALARDVFDAVGSRLAAFYRRLAQHPAVGAVIGNDDWGFKSQPMLSPDDLRRYVFPCHKQIVKAAHAAGKPAILHSCGNLETVMDDIIDDIGYDGKHSYEDTIVPVEQAYEKYHGRIAIMGGIDVDYVCRHAPQEVYDRSARMLDRVAGRGGYALGTGNSVPKYVPDTGYFAMIRAALDRRG